MTDPSSVTPPTPDQDVTPETGQKAKKKATTVQARDYDLTSAKPAPFQGPFSELWRFICWGYLKATGWKLAGDWPDHPKMVLVAAPHTSNWDGVNMIAAAGYYRIKLSWMGKKSLTTGPLGFLVKWFGCVPVERTAAHAVIGQMRDAFAARQSLVLAIAPEGTRELTHEWKKGFYHIARLSEVPIVMSVLDYGSKTIKLSGEIIPSGDYDTDIALIKAHYATAKGMKPELFEI